MELRSILKILEAGLTIHCTLFELAKLSKSRPRTKHIAVKYHHFRSAGKSGILKVKRADTKEQLADIFTKALTKPALEHLRMKIMGRTAKMFKGHLDPVTFNNITEQSLGFKWPNSKRKRAIG